MEQIVKRESYPNVQAFQKVYNKTEELIIEYNKIKDMEKSDVTEERDIVRTAEK